MSNQVMNKWYIIIASLIAAVIPVVGKTRLGADGGLALPSVPAELHQPIDRANYVIHHFWDAMDWNDTILGHNQAWLEQQLVNYLSVLPHAHIDSVAKSVDALMTSAQSDQATYELLDELATDYLFSSDSPMRNDEFYILFLQHKANSPIVSDGPKERAAWMLEELNKNRVGRLATDFKFTTSDGRTMRMSDIKTDKDILLMFYDPDCSTCHEVMRHLKTNPLDVTVVAICAEGERDAWLADARTMPSDWIVGYPDSDTAVDELYAFFQMPTILLLTPDHIVKQTNVSIF